MGASVYYYLFIVLTMLLMVTSACGPAAYLARWQPGPVETLIINEALPVGDTITAMRVKLGAGQLKLASGATGLVEGQIQYNLADWKPTLTRQEGQLNLNQNLPESLGGLPKEEIINRWDLKLGPAPLNLSLKVGASTMALDLSGLRLHNLAIADGVSQSQVTFDVLNPVEMDRLSYEAGASEVTMTGLAYANFREMNFKGGVGHYTLDFSGQLQREAMVMLTAAGSDVEIIIPATTAAKVVLSGDLSEASTEGRWLVHDRTYEIESASPLLTVNANMSLGRLTLVSR